MKRLFLNLGFGSRACGLLIVVVALSLVAVGNLHPELIKQLPILTRIGLAVVILLPLSVWAFLYDERTRESND